MPFPVIYAVQTNDHPTDNDLRSWTTVGRSADLEAAYTIMQSSKVARTRVVATRDGRVSGSDVIVASRGQDPATLWIDIP